MLVPGGRCHEDFDAGPDRDPSVRQAIPSLAASPLTVYDDQLENGFANWSWAVNSLSQTSGRPLRALGDLLRAGRLVGLLPPSRRGNRHRGLRGPGSCGSTAGRTGGQTLTVAFVLGGSPLGQGDSRRLPAGGRIPAGWVKGPHPVRGPRGDVRHFRRPLAPGTAPAATSRRSTWTTSSSRRAPLRRLRPRSSRSASIRAPAGIRSAR